jgi:hypothetical protein
MKLIQRWDGFEGTLKGWLQRFVDTIADVEEWREVGATGQPSFENSWVNYNSSTYRTAAFYKDPFGVVHIKGLVKSGSSGTTIFTLPPGNRPSLTYLVTGLQSAAAADCYITILATGDVRVNGTSVSTLASIECSFRS